MNSVDLRRIDLNLLVVFDVLMAECHVTRAAERLNRTQSAVSHALARLRAQLGDPLLVKADGGMKPSPYAEALVGEVRAILLNVQRALAPPPAFDAQTSTRHFSVVLPDLAPALFSRLHAAVQQQAPGVTLEWMLHGERSIAALLDGRADAALMPAALALPEGLLREDAGRIAWATFMRRDHPARAGFNAQAWLRCDHVAVRIGDAIASPVLDALPESARRERRIAVWVPQFAAVAPLLASSDLIATLPRVTMQPAARAFGLVAVPPPARLEPMSQQIVYSARLGAEPGRRWLREKLAQVWGQVRAEADAMLPPRR
jgi:DNA-binding transcriptional LysR family regulator